MTELDLKAVAAQPAPEVIDVNAIDSAALARLVEEVRNPGDQAVHATAYNRTYHRHNR